MHDAVADGDDAPALDRRPDAFHDAREGADVVRDIRGRPAVIGEHLALRIPRDQVRRGADALHLPVEPAFGLVADHLEQLELDRGGAGIEDEDGVAHSAPGSGTRHWPVRRQCP